MGEALQQVLPQIGTINQQLYLQQAHTFNDLIGGTTGSFTEFESITWGRADAAGLPDNGFHFE